MLLCNVVRLLCQNNCCTKNAAISIALVPARFIWHNNVAHMHRSLHLMYQLNHGHGLVDITTWSTNAILDWQHVQVFNGNIKINKTNLIDCQTMNTQLK